MHEHPKSSQQQNHSSSCFMKHIGFLVHHWNETHSNSLDSFTFITFVSIIVFHHFVPPCFPYFFIFFHYFFVPWCFHHLPPCFQGFCPIFCLTSHTLPGVSIIVSMDCFHHFSTDVKAKIPFPPFFRGYFLSFLLLKISHWWPQLSITFPGLLLHLGPEAPARLFAAAAHGALRVPAGAPEIRSVATGRTWLVSLKWSPNR